MSCERRVGCSTPRRDRPIAVKLLNLLPDSDMIGFILNTPTPIGEMPLSLSHVDVSIYRWWPAILKSFLDAWVTFRTVSHMWEGNPFWALTSQYRPILPARSASYGKGYRGSIPASADAVECAHCSGNMSTEHILECMISPWVNIREESTGAKPVLGLKSEL